MSVLQRREVQIVVPDMGRLGADLTIPYRTSPLVVFAHGSGSGRHSPRNRAVAQRLNDAGLGTLLLDLLTQAEEEAEQRGGQLRFDVDELANRLVGAVEWVTSQPDLQPESIGYFGASTGAAGALVAAARQGQQIGAVVSRGGRPDLAGALLPVVTAPTLLIVGGHDRQVLQLNKQALAQLRCPNQLEVVPGASHLFEETGTLDRVADLAADWLSRLLGSTKRS